MINHTNDKQIFYKHYEIRFGQSNLVRGFCSIGTLSDNTYKTLIHIRRLHKMFKEFSCLNFFPETFIKIKQSMQNFDTN